MKDEEIDKMADDFVNAQGFTKVYGFARKAECGAFWKYGFLAGLKAGRPQWHDLEKDPNDLPKDSGIKLCYTRTAKYVCASYDEEYDCWGFVFNNLENCIPSSVIIAWCELPTFDKE